MFGKDFLSVCGNASLIRHIKGEIRRGLIGHAYIIEGPEGVGKHAFAESFAACLICEGSGDTLPCGECAACRRLESGSHPDVKHIDSDGKASIGVSVIRELRTDTYIIPSESERKIYIIDGADTMTEQAQNAFLLSLEEPPAYVTYLLLCRDASLLLETIRSRAPSLRMAPATKDELHDFILREKTVAAKYRRLDDESRAELTVCASGNVGRAMRLLEGNALADRIREKREALDFLVSLLRGDGEAYITVGTMKKPKRESILPMVSDMISALRDMLMSKKVASFDTVFFTSADAARDAASGYSAKKLAFSIDAMRDAEISITANAQIQSALYSLAVRMKKITK